MTENPLIISSEQSLIRNGDYVLVEADRGLDVGRVVAKTPLDGFKERRLASGRSSVPFGDYKRVIKVVNEEELIELPRKLSDEENAVEVQMMKFLSYDYP